MNAEIQHNGKKYSVDFSNPLDISIPINNGLNNPNCFYAPPPEFFPVRTENFIGSRAEGGLLNFFNVKINPHGNGTHTECVGHIAKEKFTINQIFKKFHFFCELVSILPRKTDAGDRVIFRDQLIEIFEGKATKAVVIRTYPNDDLKLTTNHSNANPPYMHHEAVRYLVECGVEHLLIDLPSVDREEDDGLLLAHKAFWQYPDNVRKNCTISELIYAKNEIKDGLYLLNIQIASFELDVSPSKPILYKLKNV
ncbi:cyclase family protein [Saprospiraceae bacterium]|jgi:arylformamidase|nr:cyclase family protein [Bacteroidota bacterium]MDB4728603.1 cyclase family protein [Saprospiraceae bacterium]